MRSRGGLRRELDELVQEANRAGIGAVPMVAAARRAGEDSEQRPPGLYRQGRTQVVVYDGEFPDEATLRGYFRDAEALPLFIGGEADPALL